MLSPRNIRLQKYLLTISVSFLLAINITACSSADDSHSDISYQEQETFINIQTITDGNGITIQLCNQNDQPIQNLCLDITHETSCFLFITKNHFELAVLPAASSTTIHIPIFGFDLGILSSAPKIVLTITSPSTEDVQKTITLRIVGSHTHIISIHPPIDNSFEGYTLFSPEYCRYTFLINNNKRIIHWWKSDYIQGLGTYLLDNKELIRLDLPKVNTVFHGGGIAGRVEKFDENSNLLWEYEYSDTFHCSHHDIEPLPNGNILMIAWEYRTKAEAIAKGRNPSRLQSDSLWPDHIIEVQPTGHSSGEIVWEWHVWDHLIQDYDSTKDNYGIVQDHPELVDINYGPTTQDWNHINAVDYNEQYDQILLSVHNFNEIWIIDHNTTTEEAASHVGGKYGKGGDLLYRWGNPAAYKSGDKGDQQFFGQHGANWIDSGCPGEGNIIVFNNGDRNRRYSTVDEIQPPVDNNGNYSYVPGTAYGPTEPIWEYVAENPADLYSPTLSNAQRLPNGNTLICSANQGLFLEVTTGKTVVWKYTNIIPSPFHNAVGRIQRYPVNYPGIPETLNWE